MAATLDMKALDIALNLLPSRFKGPGGVAGIVKDGVVVAKRAWGFRDFNRRLPMTVETRLPICSISKQFTCALLLDQCPDPSVLDGKVADWLPQYREQRPAVAQLCHNQSGMRDYWALTVLQGAVPEGEFRKDDARILLRKTKTGHFTPGAHYSYNNGNFRMLADMIEEQSGRDFASLLRERVLLPAGMTSAAVAPDTAAPLDDVVGYEGSDDMGFVPARNGIYWIGDAGMSVSLDGMLAWEQFIDATRDDPRGLYNRLSAPVTFSDGTAASYGFGLRRDRLSGVEVTCHGGGLRGFSTFRLHARDERLSIVVMFNHEGGASRAAAMLLEVALGHTPAARSAMPQGWPGLWLDRAQALLLRTTPTLNGAKLYYGYPAADLSFGDDGMARSGAVSVWRDGGTLHMQRPAENLHVVAEALVPDESDDGASLSGRYWCEELEAHLDIEARDGAAFAVFDGMFGKGPAERMYAMARDLWVISTRRSMDAAPPGDWTVLVERNRSGRVTGLTLGCWLARKLRYVRED